ncbi:hypothetical protein RHECNPAF_122100122 [Rhizobium etli CNPAF512]|nr:hypothetical protein RHECNPAF_122100122 [Rhizobium etli CNPAF512]
MVSPELMGRIVSVSIRPSTPGLTM